MIVAAERSADRIRLTAIKTMKGAFGNEGALRFLINADSLFAPIGASRRSNRFSLCGSICHLERLADAKQFLGFVAPVADPNSSRSRPDAGFFSQEREYFFHQRVRSNAMFLSQDRDGAVLDKLIGPSDADHWSVDHLRMQMLHHRTSEAVVQNVIFDGADDFDAAREKFERAGIERLDPARIDECDGNTFLFQFARG